MLMHIVQTIQNLKTLVLLIILLGVFTCIPSYALSLNTINYSDLTPINTDMTMKIGEEVKLLDPNIKTLPNKKDLDNFSVYLRDIARNLGSHQIIPGLAIPSHALFNYPGMPQLLPITDIKAVDGNWNTLTVGHILRLVTEELQVIDNSLSQPNVEVLLQDNISQNYYPLMNLPLNYLCYLLLKISNYR